MGQDAPIRVMVVDDHPMWRDAVARDLTEAGYDVVATAADGAQALRVAGPARPDVVVLDLQLPDMSGVEVTRGLRAAHPAARVLVLSASGEQQDVLDAVKAGAVGYLLKSAARPEFLDAVRRTAGGDAVARDLTEAGYEVVATVTDGAQALRVAGPARPDVVVLDLQLPDMSGVEVTRGLRATHPAARVLVLSASAEQQDVLDAVKAGAAGYLLKSAARPELLDAVRRTAGGDAVFTPGLAALVLGEFRRLAAAPGADATDTPRLTERETEILRMVATGLSYKQIAARLVLSHRTVQNHVQNTLGKLQLHNRVELVRYAIEHGLAGEPEP